MPPVYDIAVFDGNNLTRRAQYAHADLSVHAAGREPMPTGVCFGVMKAIEKINDIAYRAEVVWDAGHKFRSKLDPGYKANRRATGPVPPEIEESEADYRKQLALAQSMLRNLGVAQVSAPGEEADDVIATLVRRYEAEGLRVLIVSTDQDFYQLVRNRVHILASKGGNDVYVTRKHLMRETGLKPQQFLDVMSFCGDRGDNVKGVPRIGEKTAIDIVKAAPGLAKAIVNDEPFEGWDADVPTRVLTLMRAAVFEHKKIVKLARRLTRLRTLPEVSIDVGERDLRKLRQQCTMLGFRSLLDQDAWAKLTKIELNDEAPKSSIKNKARAKLAALPKAR